MSTRVRCRTPLPPVAFAAQPSTGATIMIRRGERRYYVLTTRLGADDLNQAFGVSAEQASAMLAGVRFGWSCPAADPDTYVADRQENAPAAGKPSGRIHRTSP